MSARAARLLVVAGEASGDRHAAGLIEKARASVPALSVQGIGGDHLRALGAEIFLDSREIAVVGISEVLERLPAIRRALAEIKRRLREERPDALLLVDFPDFNLHVAGVARKLGIPVVYFVSPQIWAWRARRIKQIKQRVSRMIVLFPFERDFYAREGVPVTFAGHPLADQLGTGREPAEARRRLGLDPAGPIFGLLPGSRTGELARMLVPMLETARLVLDKKPSAAFLIPVASTVDPEPVYDAAARSGLPVVALRNAFDEIAEACDAALVASGTATLELAVRGVPPVVVYRTSRTTYMIGRMAVRVPHISLVNLIAERELVPELIQEDFTPERAASELVRLGCPGEVREEVLEGLRAVRARLGPPGAYQRAADALVEVLEEAKESRT